jgi:quinol monooxygenase YgiN
MIIIAGTIDVDPTRRDACVAACAPVQMATRKDEPGCLAYCFASDPSVEGRIQVYELWTDQASLQAHFTHPNYFAMRDLLHTFEIRKADNKKYRVDLSEPVYDADRKPRADFFTDPNAQQAHSASHEERP